MLTNIPVLLLSQSMKPRRSSARHATFFDGIEVSAKARLQALGLPRTANPLSCSDSGRPSRSDRSRWKGRNGSPRV